MDCTAVAGGISLRPRSPLPATRPRCYLWRQLSRAGTRLGHPRSPMCTALSLAEGICRAGDWFHSTFWTMSSCSMKPPCVELSLVISGTITERGRTFHWGRTRPSRDQFNRRKWDTLWRCRKWAGYTTAMNDEPPEQPETRLLCCRFRFRYHAEQRSSPQLLAMRTATTVGI